MKKTVAFTIVLAFTHVGGAAHADDRTADGSGDQRCTPWPPCQVVRSGLNPGKPGNGLNPKGNVIPETKGTFTYDSNVVRLPAVKVEQAPIVQP